MKDQNLRKTFKLYDPAREGKGVSKNASDYPMRLRRFFISFKDNIGKLVSVNIIMVLGNFPLLFAIAALAGYTQNETTLPISDLFQNIRPLITIDEPDVLSLVFYGMEGMQHQTLLPSILTYVFYGIGILFLFTFGLVNVGCAYVLRNLAQGEPVFVWTDFWYAVKQNYKQAIPMGILDAIICFILPLNIYSMLLNTSTFFTSFLLWANIFIFLAFFFMRYYVYVQMVTFKLSIFKIIKNSLIFSLLGIKRNLVALGGILIGVVLEAIFIFSFGGLLLPFAVATPLILFLSTFAYMKVFAAYAKIDQYMIAPYKKEDPIEEEQTPIMHDDVTERERLEEIKKRNNIK